MNTKQWLVALLIGGAVGLSVSPAFAEYTRVSPALPDPSIATPFSEFSETWFAQSVSGADG